MNEITTPPPLSLIEKLYQIIYDIDIDHSNLSKENILNLLKQGEIDIPCKKCPVYIMCKSKIINHIQFKKDNFKHLNFTEQMLTNFFLEDMIRVYQSLINECPYIKEFDVIVNKRLYYYNLLRIRRLMIQCIFDVSY